MRIIDDTGDLIAPLFVYQHVFEDERIQDGMTRVAFLYIYPSVSHATLFCLHWRGIHMHIQGRVKDATETLLVIKGLAQDIESCDEFVQKLLLQHFDTLTPAEREFKFRHINADEQVTVS